MRLSFGRFATSSRTGTSAFSLVEVMLSIGAAIIIGGLALGMNTTALHIVRKNGAINANHESARNVIDRLEKEIQSAISIPALVGANRDVIDSTGPAPGIAFLRQSGPIRKLAATALTGSNVIQLDNGPSAVLGQRVLIPAYDIEGDVTAVSGNTVTLATSLPIDVKITSGALDRNIVVLITDLVTYVVVGSELREYQNAATNNYNVVAHGVTEPNPFGLPFNAVPNSTPAP